MIFIIVFAGANKSTVIWFRTAHGITLPHRTTLISAMAFGSRPVIICLFLVLVVCGSLMVDAVPSSLEGRSESGGVHWALIVAGSSGWDNYRHQVCHQNWFISWKNQYPVLVFLEISQFLIDFDNFWNKDCSWYLYFESPVSFSEHTEVEDISWP